MNDLFAFVAHHGYLAVAAVVFSEAIDLPLPAAVALIAAGAAGATHSLSLASVVAVALCAMLAGDCLMYLLGRSMGWRLLSLICKISINPETCILRSAESFYKRGRVTLLVSKFVPGLNAMAPPLAGSMNMRFSQFLALDAGGALLYIVCYSVLGYLFRDLVASITQGVQTAGHAVAIVVVCAFVGYLAYRLWLYRKNRVYRVVPRVQVAELANRLRSEEADRILVVDVRSHGYYDSGAARIRGSVRIEPNNLPTEIENLPKTKDIYVYCT
ncbi:MAG TPA: VTT domain-containing protein [Terriglobales bacterium]|nr:VTT domain-containing protein [Terriglobales bacterium]